VALVADLLAQLEATGHQGAAAKAAAVRRKSWVERAEAEVGVAVTGRWAVFCRAAAEIAKTALWAEAAREDYPVEQQEAEVAPIRGAEAGVVADTTAGAGVKREIRPIEVAVGEAVDQVILLALRRSTCRGTPLLQPI
jgi:hypothetical protein